MFLDLVRFLGALAFLGGIGLALISAFHIVPRHPQISRTRVWLSVAGGLGLALIGSQLVVI